MIWVLLTVRFSAPFGDRSSMPPFMEKVLLESSVTFAFSLSITLTLSFALMSLGIVQFKGLAVAEVLLAIILESGHGEPLSLEYLPCTYDMPPYLFHVMLV